MFWAFEGPTMEKTTGLEKKLLSAAGKEILAKTMAQVVPNYTMSWFLLPKLFCEDINRMTASFW